MKYRKFGRLDWNVSALGFGCMRLPTLDNNPMSGNIDEPEAVRMIRRAIDGGVNYIDTAYPYHNGNSEVVTGKALQDGFREKVRLATKSPVWLLQGPADFDTYLGQQLQRLNIDHIDLYLLHALDRDRWENNILRHDVLRHAEAALRDGRIGHLGFSFHDEAAAFRPIVDGFDGWTFCQLQYNYMDIENQAGAAGVKYAASKGLAVICMEPIMGGRLANPPEDIKSIFDGHPRKQSPASWALQWVWDQQEVSLALSGMSTMQQVDENLAAADAFGEPHSLSSADIQMIGKVREKFRERAAIQCTKCGYCSPCPNGVNIPGVFEMYNNGVIYENMEASRFAYERFMEEGERADQCIQCRVCEEKCPQKLTISELMPKVHAALSRAATGTKTRG